MSRTVLKIDGMMCGHCKMAVEKALKILPGVDDVQVNLDTKEAVVTGTVERSAMVNAVDKAGYKVSG